MFKFPNRSHTKLFSGIALTAGVVLLAISYTSGTFDVWFGALLQITIPSTESFLSIGFKSLLAVLLVIGTFFGLLGFLNILALLDISEISNTLKEITNGIQDPTPDEERPDVYKKQALISKGLSYTRSKVYPHIADKELLEKVSSENDFVKVPSTKVGLSFQEEDDFAEDRTGISFKNTDVILLSALAGSLVSIPLFILTFTAPSRHPFEIFITWAVFSLFIYYKFYRAYSKIDLQFKEFVKATKEYFSGQEEILLKVEKETHGFSLVISPNVHQPPPRHTTFLLWVIYRFLNFFPNSVKTKACSLILAIGLFSTAITTVHVFNTTDSKAFYLNKEDVPLILNKFDQHVSVKNQDSFDFNVELYQSSRSFKPFFIQTSSFGSSFLKCEEYRQYISFKSKFRKEESAPICVHPELAKNPEFVSKLEQWIKKYLRS